MKQLIEQIKPIKGYEGLYSVSNYGYVISEEKEWSTGTNNNIHRKSKSILKYTLSRGYKLVSLCRHGKVKAASIHRIVWDHFGDQPRNGRKLQVDHIDNNKLNNRINNLQLLSCSQNVAKYYKTQKLTSKYTGVYLVKSINKWRARIMLNGVRTHLGDYALEIDAHIAYQKELEEPKKEGE